MSLDTVSNCMFVNGNEKSTHLVFNDFALNSQQFNKAAEDIKGLTSRPTDDELKEIYALYKQATVGDVNVGNESSKIVVLSNFSLDVYKARPGMLDFKGKAKWDAWESKKGMSSDAAKQAYIDKATELVKKYNV